MKSFYKIIVMVFMFGSNLFATTTIFTFDRGDARLSTISKTVDGLTITLSNPTSGSFFADSSGVYIIRDSTSITNSLDIAFSETVKLISYNIMYVSNLEGDEVSTYRNNGLESVENSPFTRGVRSFANPLTVASGSTISVSTTGVDTK